MMLVENMPSYKIFFFYLYRLNYHFIMNFSIYSKDEYEYDLKVNHDIACTGYAHNL